MSAILESVLTPEQKAQADAADRAAEAAQQKPRWTHGPNGGTSPNTLDTLPVVLRYELTNDLCGSEIAEVTEVEIAGHVICAEDFAADIRAEWGRQCMAARGGL
jgi:hypothetical protein